MNAVYVLVTAFLLDLSHSNNEGSSCCYNYDCTSDYSNDAVSNCYMIATFGYDSSTSEGFCWGGDCYPVFYWNGVCRAKQALGAACQNSAGHYDNNNCVTRFCNDESGVCEQRTSGCPSVESCIAIGVAIVKSLANYAGQWVGQVADTWESVDCDEGGSVCAGTGLFSPQLHDFWVGFTASAFVNDSLTLTGLAWADFPTLRFDADFMLPQLDLVVEGLSLGYDLDFEFTLSASTGYEFEHDLVLSNGLDICEHPLNSTLCKPYIVLSKSLQLGYISVHIEVGFQMVGKISGSVEASSEFVLSWHAEGRIDLEPLGVGANENGIYIIGDIDNLFDTSSNEGAKWMTLDVAADAYVHADLEAHIGPQLYIDVNGIRVYGGVDLAFRAMGELTANAVTGCASGAAGISYGVMVNFYSPPFSLETGIEAVCKSVFGRVADVVDVVIDDVENAYGTQCQLYMDACDARFDLCKRAAEDIVDVMDKWIGSQMELDGYYVCDVVFEWDTAIVAEVNGADCGPDDMYWYIDCADHNEAAANSDGGIDCPSTLSAYLERMQELGIMEED